MAAAGARCNDGRFTCTLLRRQDSSLSVEMTWPADSAVSLVDAVQSGAVSGVPPTAAVRVVNPATGAAVPEAAPAPIAASAYYRIQTVASNAECPTPDPAQMKSKLTAAGLATTERFAGLGRSGRHQDLLAERLDDGRHRIGGFGQPPVSDGASATEAKGFSLPDAVLTGVETRTSAPLRIDRGEDFQSLNTVGLYPAGEGAGYAGGILSAAIDGIKVGEAVAQSILAA